MSHFEGLRLKYKHQLNEKLKWLKNTDKWKQFMQDMELQDYDVVIADYDHYDELLKLAADNYWDTNVFPRMVGITKKELIRSFKPRIKFITDYSRGLVAVNLKTQKICGLSSFIDVCDGGNVKELQYYKDISFQSRLRYLFELNSTLTDVAEIKTIDHEYGKGVWGGSVVISKTEQQLKLLPVIFVAGFIILAEIGYQKSFGEVNHIRLLKTLHLFGGNVVNSVDWKNFVFKDGKKMKDLLLHEMDENNYNLNAIPTSGFDFCVLSFINNDNNKYNYANYCKNIIIKNEINKIKNKNVFK
eukprot:445352_1